jgi:hypothetical protein
MRFDAYAGNVYGGDRPEAIAEVVGFSVKGRVQRGKPRGRYSDVFEVRDAETPVGWFGWDRVLGATYFEAKGERTPDVVGALRRHWAEDHTVSRVDACEDFDGPGAFDVLKRRALDGLDPRVKAITIAPEPGRGDGRTFYLGSPGGVALCRQYEAGLMRDRAHLLRPHWVRQELEVRPPKARDKRAAAKWSSVDVWGASAWSAALALRTLRLEVPRVVVQAPPDTVTSTQRYVGTAFRRMWQEMLADYGSWECIGREFEALWAEDDRLAAATDAASARH